MSISSKCPHKPQRFCIFVHKPHVDDQMRSLQNKMQIPVMSKNVFAINFFAHFVSVEHHPPKKNCNMHKSPQNLHEYCNIYETITAK